MVAGEAEFWAKMHALEAAQQQREQQSVQKAQLHEYEMRQPGYVPTQAERQAGSAGGGEILLAIIGLYILHKIGLLSAFFGQFK